MRFAIDPGGITRPVGVLTPPVVRKFSASVQQIRAFQRVCASDGKEATPAG